MKNKFVLYFTIYFFVFNLKVNFNEATPAITRVGNEEENSRILCETVCSTPEWKVAFDKEKSAYLCTATDNTNGSEEALLKTPNNTNSVTTISSENKPPCKRDITATLRKDNDTSMPSVTERNPSDKLKTKKVKPSNVNIKTNVTNKQEKIVITKGKDINENTHLKNSLKNTNDIEVLPQKVLNETESNTNEGKNVKRIPKDNTKQFSEMESHSTEITGKEGIEIGHLKPQKSLKKSKSSGTMASDTAIKDTYLKLVTPSKKGITSCNSLSITNQLRNAKERISKLMNDTKQPNFNCGLLNKEIDSIKAILQVIYKGPETKQRELDRTKILEQIREKEKERHARIQSRLGHLELTKHKPVFVGRMRTTEKTPPSDEKSKLQPKTEDES